jgi:hypothetical protein
MTGRPSIISESKRKKAIKMFVFGSTLKKVMSELNITHNDAYAVQFDIHKIISTPIFFGAATYNEPYWETEKEIFESLDPKYDYSSLSPDEKKIYDELPNENQVA